MKCVIIDLNTMPNLANELDFFAELLRNDINLIIISGGDNLGQLTIGIRNRLRGRPGLTDYAISHSISPASTLLAEHHAAILASAREHIPTNENLHVLISTRVAADAPENLCCCTTVGEAREWIAVAESQWQSQFSTLDAFDPRLWSQERADEEDDAKASGRQTPPSQQTTQEADYGSFGT